MIKFVVLQFDKKKLPNSLTSENLYRVNQNKLSMFVLQSYNTAKFTRSFTIFTALLLT